MHQSRPAATTRRLEPPLVSFWTEPHRGEHALLGDAPVEVDLAVAGALELLVDDVVHLRARVDERRGENREAPALLDVTGGAEEALGTLQRVGVHAAGQHL